MRSGRNRGLVQTVLGPVSPSELGPTTTHEHLYLDFSFMYRPAQDTPDEELGDAPVTLENLGWIRRNYYSNRSNLTLMDLDTTIEEVRRYSDVGGGAIVDATLTGIGRNPDALATISRESGVHIVMGSGFYVDTAHPEDMDRRSVDDLASEIIGDIATKHRLVRYGGHGYGHILENIVPKMRRKGLSEDTIRAITVDNPARILTLA